MHLVHSYFSPRHRLQYIAGTVIDGKTRHPIALADVTIVDTGTNTVASILKTDRHGHYFFRMTHEGVYQIEIIKPGYEHLEPVVFDPNLSPYHIIHVIHASRPHKPDFYHLFADVLSTLFGLLFELLLTLSFLFEIVFVEYFGLWKTIPYICISFLNLTLWIAIHHHNREHIVE